MNACPYQGLTPFTEQDQKYFSGREREVKLAISQLYGSPLSILYGESGVGKTSLIWAGMLPVLQSAEHRVATVLFRDWQTQDFEKKLRDEIVDALLLAINRLRKELDSKNEPITRDQFVDDFSKSLNLKSADELYNAIPLDRFIKECCLTFNGRMFFIFDQFEEYIYYHPLKADGDRFDAAFANAINDRRIAASFLLSLREDGLGKLDRLRPRIPDLLGNVIRLDHLDKVGAERAIERPLEVFSENKPFKVQAQGGLINALLEQVDADRLEMDEGGDLPLADLPQGDRGPRYKAVALQAVLTRLWDEDVGPFLGSKSAPTGTIWLTADRLTALAKDKKRNETEVRFLIRTYFDKRLESLGDKTPAAAEILRGLVRAGGHKRARTVKALSEETMLPENEVAGLLEKLASPPVSILRTLPTSSGVYYELKHDVMAFAMMDWSNRQRQTEYEKQLKKKTKRRQTLFLAGATVLIAGVVLYELWQLSERKKKLAVREMEQMEEEKLVDASFASLGLGNSPFSPELATLLAVDSVGECRGHDIPVPPRAALGLALVNIVNKRNTQEPKDIDVQEALSLVPCVESPDQELQLAVTAPGKVELRKRDGAKKEFSTGDKKITGIGFNDTGTRFGIAVEGNAVTVWNISQLQSPEPSTNGPLEKALKIAEPQRAQRWFRMAPPTGWEHSYDEVTNDFLVTAISQITTSYSPDQRLQLAGRIKPLSDEINNAYDALKHNDTKRAIQLLGENLRRLKITLGPDKIKQVLATNLFRRATMLTKKTAPESTLASADKDAQENALRLALDLDPGTKAEIDEFRASEKAKSEGQLAAEAKKQSQVIEYMEQGNNFARAGDKQKAIEAYNKAIEIDPRLRATVIPETEYLKFAPGATGSAPEPTP